VTGILPPDPRTSNVTTSQTTTGVPAPRTSSGATGRPPARRAPELAPLALDDLRTYRQELITEESRVSYWRRILQSRLDLALGDECSLGRLRRVLSEHQESSRRLAVFTLDDPAGAPPLPDLTVLWETETGSGEDGSLLTRLAAAEHQLSAYRRSLHARLDAATGELISRYRDQPSLALHALPLGRTA
jgi:hypothetical protein